MTIQTDPPEAEAKAEAAAGAETDAEAALSLAQLLDRARPEAGGLRFPISPNWAQGRTAFGGLTAAMLLAAARTGRPDLPPLRSALINFTAPVGAAPRIAVEELRRGRNVTTLQARAEIEGRVAALAGFSFGRAQDSHVSAGCPAAPAPAPEDCPPFIPPGAARVAPRFIGNFETRLIDGARPFSAGGGGAGDAWVRGWARHRDREMWDRPEGLLAIADLLPPAVFSICRKPGPNSSVNWLCNILTEEIRTEDGWWMLESRLSAGANGYSSQQMRVWNRAGELVADGLQSVLIFA